MTCPPLYVVTGVANEASLAWAVADRLLHQGESCLLACLPKNRHRAEKLLRGAGREAQIVALDVREDASLSELGRAIEGRRVAGVLHAIAYANMEDLVGPVREVSRAGFAEAMDVSVYSLLALVHALDSALGRGSSVVALSYHGAQKCLPGYNLMGIAKAALESACRYLAHELGPRGIRVNCASPGPLLTLSSSAFTDIEAGIERAAQAAPLRGEIQREDVAAAVAFLMAAGAGITGQTVYVDNGLSIMGG